MPGTPPAQRADDPVAPGQLLADRFRVMRRIAQGGMGVVYEAFDEKLGRRIALKCARGGHDRHLSPEVRLATEVSHPNICKIYEIHSAQTPAGPLEFFTMEFLEGPTLYRRLEEGRIDRKEAEAIARDLCAGLAEAHRHQVIHGDMKSANVILTRNPDGTPRAVITDFGLARAARTSGIRGGSPGYMAPELYAGQPTTVASDIYALGVILHELACGVRPDERVAMAASTATLLPSDPPVKLDHRRRLADLSQAPPPPLRSRWDPILKRCLQTDPKLRYETVDQVRLALGPSVARRRVLILAGAVVLAAVAALLTYWKSTAPAQTVRLDVDAVQGSPQLAVKVRQQMAQLKNSPLIAFFVNASRATHRLSADVTPKAGKLRLHAVLSDLRSGAPVTEWAADYEPAQLRYAPVALAGVVSSTFHLPALTTYATVNASAAATYQQGLAIMPDDRKLDEALVAFQSAAALDPDSALPLAGLAEVQRRKYFLTEVQSWEDAAMAAWQQAELRNPDSAEVHRIAGLLEYDHNHPEQALARMRRATEFQPPHRDAYRRLGALYQQKGQLPEALQAYLKAQSIAPGDTRIYEELAHVYSVQSNFAEASKALQRAVELAPDRPHFRRLLALAYQDQGQFAEAESSLRTVLAQERSADNLRALGHVLMYQKRDEEAIGLLSEAAKLGDQISFTWLCLGLASQRTGRTADSRRAFQKGLTIAEHEVVQVPRSGYYHASLAYFCAQTGQTERAGMEAAQAVQLAPHHNDTIWMATLTYERIGNRAAALKTLESAPRSLMEDMHRWPEAAALTSDQGFSQLSSAPGGQH
ncbi:MAG TPA: protein kinase [Candidatus Acidoferrales bacterium]|jgi:tetratricopeptide (TPR) repeat protein|nr:protein kinase [Candidatus Acidoferrales bacterium]